MPDVTSSASTCCRMSCAKIEVKEVAKLLYSSTILVAQRKCVHVLDDHLSPEVQQGTPPAGVAYPPARTIPWPIRPLPGLSAIVPKLAVPTLCPGARGACPQPLRPIARLSFSYFVIPAGNAECLITGRCRSNLGAAPRVRPRGKIVRRTSSGVSRAKVADRLRRSGRQQRHQHLAE